MNRTDLLLLVGRALEGDDRKDDVLRLLEKRIPLNGRRPPPTDEQIDAHVHAARANDYERHLIGAVRDLPYWVRENAERIHVHDMTDGHLANTCAKLLRGEVTGRNSVNEWRRAMTTVLLEEAEFRQVTIRNLTCICGKPVWRIGTACSAKCADEWQRNAMKRVTVATCGTCGRSGKVEDSSWHPHNGAYGGDVTCSVCKGMGNVEIPDREVKNG